MFGRRIFFWKKEFLNRNVVLKDILMGILFKTLFIKKCYSTQEYFFSKFIFMGHVLVHCIYTLNVAEVPCNRSLCF